MIWRKLASLHLCFTSSLKTSLVDFAETLHHNLTARSTGGGEIQESIPFQPSRGRTRSEEISAGQGCFCCRTFALR